VEEHRQKLNDLKNYSNVFLALRVVGIKYSLFLNQELGKPLGWCLIYLNATVIFLVEILA
jgi:hypothetical protein